MRIVDGGTVTETFS